MSPAPASTSSIEALIIFPHQLFAANAVLARDKWVFLVEDALYFTQYRFHKQKLVLHRASMQAHAALLRPVAKSVDYLDSAVVPTMRAALQRFASLSLTVHYIDPVDDWLQRRLLREAASRGVALVRHPSHMFINDREALRPHFGGPSLSMAEFYTKQRKRHGILVVDGRPAGGKWSFDQDNRRRLPRGIDLPPEPAAEENPHIVAARRYVDAHFGDNPGRADALSYPVTAGAARDWLTQFLDQRLERFGAYEDAISSTERVLFHSVLTPMLNIGLLTPAEVVEATLGYARVHETPLNSLEGFLRQIIGWREFVRATYEFHGRRQRVGNAWDHHRPLPRSFWTATTGIPPVDTVIARVLATGYAHHIERLMVLANFMMLCEFEPDEVYRWFMELFIDAYDWVMVPNVYGMGLNADGGFMMTKPYISGSAYILRMSDHERGPWCAIWDGLFWRFVAKHRKTLSANHRLAVVVRNLDRIDSATLRSHIETAEAYLAQCR